MKTVLAMFFGGLLLVAAWPITMAVRNAEGVVMATSVWVALALGVVFAMAMGAALMTLLFLNSLRGYDNDREVE